MAIVNYNSNSLPYTFNGVYKALNQPPSVSQTGISTGTTPSAITSPIQIAGLIPVFPCCSANSSAYLTYNFSFVACDTVSQYKILIGSNPYYFNVLSVTTAAGLQTIINTALPSGITATVIKTGNTFSVVLTANISFYGTTISVSFVSGCGSTVSSNQKGRIWSYVPVVNCNCDCRQGNYSADAIPDDRFFTLPIFASQTCSGSYENDINSWIFQYASTYNPISNGDFKLQKLTSNAPANPNSTWSTVATLNNTTYGTPIYTGGTCTNNIGGFQLNWNLVLSGLGAGVYRFYVSGTFSASAPYCLFSPPLCLNSFDCNLANGTVKYEATYCGGNIGSVTTQGQAWSLCCVPLNSSYSTSNSCTNGNTLPGATFPFPYYDSIRFPGYFGREGADYTMDSVKYATGVIYKTREEATKTFSLDTDLLPWWFHQRFYSYGLMADNLYVSDYNYNNPNYNYKYFNVIRDSSYQIKYSDNSLRMKKITGLKFKEQTQLTYRDRCC